jgi:transposase
MKFAELTDSARQSIVTRHQAGESYGKIAAEFKISKSTVFCIVQKYTETGAVSNRTGRGRKEATSVRQKRAIVRQVELNRRLSAASISVSSPSLIGTKISLPTVSKILNKAGLFSRVAPKKPLLTKTHTAKRLKWARDHVNKTPEFWKKVLWSDESKFNLIGSDGPHKVWKRPKELLRNDTVRPVVKHGGGSVMVWGCFGLDGVGSLEVINGIMTGVSYRDLLDRNLKESARNLGILDDFVFQQDNDPKHTSKIVGSFLRESGTVTMDFPPCSLDLNPIEHLWSIVKKNLQGTTSRSRQELVDKVKRIWTEISIDQCRRLVESMPKRCMEVIKNKGGHTSY